LFDNKLFCIFKQLEGNNMTSYTRDDNLAVQPETNVGGRIETSGAYVGHFTQAKERTAKTGTKGIEFNFEAEDGRVARYLTL
jgi:hypothetical protein